MIENIVIGATKENAKVYPDAGDVNPAEAPFSYKVYVSGGRIVVFNVDINEVIGSLEEGKEGSIKLVLIFLPELSVVSCLKPSTTPHGKSEH